MRKGLVAAERRDSASAAAPRLSDFLSHVFPQLSLWAQASCRSAAEWLRVAAAANHGLEWS